MTAQAIMERLKANGFQHVYETISDEIVIRDTEPHFCTIKKDTNGTWKPKVTAIVYSSLGWITYIVVYFGIFILLNVFKVERMLIIDLTLPIFAFYTQHLVDQKRRKAKQTELEQRLSEIITVDGGR